MLQILKPRKLLTYLCLSSLSLFSSPVMAAESVLGVVKSVENTPQWEEITTRLNQIGVNYCVVETKNWRQEIDLGSISVLLLPSVGSFNGSQTVALEQWMNKGGKVIVTGPTANLSPPSIRERLRSLFGAYWAYPLASPTTLELSANTPSQWNGRTLLENTFMGAAVIPTDNNGQTAANWIVESNPPAAIVTDNSTVLGWRWGSNAVADASLDTAWLQASLNRYGISTYGRFTPENQDTEEKPCRPEIVPQNESQPFIPGWELENNPSPESRFDSLGNNGFALQEKETMIQELEGLIGRFETTLLTADARASQINSSTSELINQLISQGSQNSSKSATKQVSDSTYPQAHKALEKAKTQFQQFLESIEQGRYSQAKRQWLAARNTLWDDYPTDRQVATSEIRAIWLDRGTIVKARSERDLVKLFDRLEKAGINAVFFETVNSGYTIHPSKIAPQQNPLVRGWDPLEVAVKLAHERNMELHAWVWTFAAVNQRHNVILNLPEDDLGPVLSRYPDWAITDKKGDRFHYTSGKAFLDPANPGVRRYLTLLLEEIATRYDVDGIHLDYIRYPFQSPTGEYTYGYGLASRQEFEKLTGVDPVEINYGGSLWNQWTGFRLKQIDNFVASVSQRLKQKRPDLILSTAVFPIPRQERINKIQQHWEEWVREEWIDMLVPMTYALDTEQLKTLTRPLLEDFSEGKALLLPGIRLLNVPDVVAVDQMQLLRGMSAEGYALFAAENFRPSLAEIFNRLQGNLETISSEPLPHRQPFRSTQVRYRSLKQEWNYLISNHQIEMDEQVLKTWGRQADDLSVAFQQLAENPSPRNFLAAQSSLSAFRRQFPSWMEQNKTINTYQAQVWENRLETLTRLLNYGENRILSANK
ncbi:glycoside hydrolase family 10 protein [Hyella patelloides]|uniref:glycoside hydrolase family 10 protein n=1 Tax=Hyella patelloides TaxID=1982969 RepID=UPI003CCC6D1E